MAGIIIGGLIGGSFFAILAIGMVLIYRTSSAINFAQADIGGAGVFAAIAVTGGLVATLPRFVGAIVGVVFAAALSFAIYLLIIRPIERSRADTFSTMAATLGVSLVIEGILQIVFGFNPYAFALFPRSEQLNLFGTKIPAAGIAIIASAVLALALLAFVLYRTRIGLIVRMGGSSETLTQLSGVRVSMVRATVWAVAGALGGWALILYADYQYASPTIAGGLLISAAVAASWGRFRSIPWTLAGAVITGIVLNIVARYIPFTFTESASLVMLVGVFLVLQKWQPSLPERSHGTSSAGLVRAVHRLRPRIGIAEQLVVAAAAIAGWLLVRGYQEQILEQILTYAIAFAGLSLSVRYNGRLNLSGAGFLALGAYGSAVLDSYLPAPISLIVTLISAAAIAAVFAALTARMEMIYYIQISLLITAAAAEIISLASRWTQGNEGMSVNGYFSNYAILGVPGSVLLVVVLALVSLVIVARMGSSAVGVRALLTSTDRRLSESLGLRSRWQFIRIEAVSGILIALSGALTAHTTGYISPDQYSVSLSIMMFAMVVLSGGWTSVGLALGAVIYVIVPVLVGTLNNLPQLIFGAMLIAFAMFAPSGIEGWLSAVYQGIGDRMPGFRGERADITAAVQTSSVAMQGARHDE